MQLPPPGRSLILYDGACGFCRASVAWMLRHDRSHRLVAQPYQDANLTPQLRAACEKAVQLLDSKGTVFGAGRAVLAMLKCSRWHRLARVLEWPVLLFAVELGYWQVARHRGAISRVLRRVARRAASDSFQATCSCEVASKGK